MQAALLMTEELLVFLVRPSYYRKLICKHILHPSHEPRRDATGRDTSFGSRGHWNRIRTVGSNRCKMVSYHKGSLVTAPVLPWPTRISPFAHCLDVPTDSCTQLQSIERRHTWRRPPASTVRPLDTQVLASRAFVEQRMSRPNCHGVLRLRSPTCEVPSRATGPPPTCCPHQGRRLRTGGCHSRGKGRELPLRRRLGPFATQTKQPAPRIRP